MVRRNDEGEAQRRRWTFYEAIKIQPIVNWRIHSISTQWSCNIIMDLKMIINELELKDISSVVAEELAALYLYGSSVKGRLREESDVDIAILPSHKIDEEERLILIAKVEGIIDKLLRGKGTRREISILDLRGKFVPLTLQYKVITEGILLYEKDTLERIEFENTVKGEYFDFKSFLQRLRKKKYGHIHQEV